MPSMPPGYTKALPGICGKELSGHNSDLVCDAQKIMNWDMLARQEAQRYSGIVTQAAEHSNFYPVQLESRCVFKCS